MNTTTWTHPSTGQVRRYLDNEQVYKVASKAATARELPYRGADYDRILAAKFWLDSDGELHVDHLSERGRVDEADVRAAVVASLNA
jgi:hypothetical protein